MTLHLKTCMLIDLMPIAILLITLLMTLRSPMPMCLTRVRLMTLHQLRSQNQGSQCPKRGLQALMPLWLTKFQTHASSLSSRWTSQDMQMHLQRSWKAFLTMSRMQEAKAMRQPTMKHQPQREQTLLVPAVATLQALSIINTQSYDSVGVPLPYNMALTVCCACSQISFHSCEAVHFE